MPKTENLLSKITKSLRAFFSSFFKISTKKTKILIVLGVICLCIPSIFYVNQTIQLEFFTPKVVPVKSSLPEPTLIEIPAVQISLPVEQTAISNNVWGISQNGVSYLAISARPGGNGPIIMYAHNTDNRFGPIRWLSKGQAIQVTTKDSKQHSYTIDKTLEVSPNQIDVLLSQKKETLILYTCSGFADLKRFVVIAFPSGSSATN